MFERSENNSFNPCNSWIKRWEVERQESLELKNILGSIYTKTSVKR